MSNGGTVLTAALDVINAVGRWSVILFVIDQAASLASSGVMSEQATAAILGSAITAISTAAGVAMANGSANRKAEREHARNGDVQGS